MLSTNDLASNSIFVLVTHRSTPTSFFTYRWTVTVHMVSVFSLSWSTMSRVLINIKDKSNFMVKSELGYFTTLALQQQFIKTGGYYFENLTGWQPAFDAFVMVRSREMITKDNVIKIKALWAKLQGDIGRQRQTTIELLILYSSKRYSFDCRTRTR